MTDESRPRRRRRRPSGMAFSRSGMSASSHAEGAGSDADLDPNDDGLDADLNEEVTQQAAAIASTHPPQEPELADERLYVEQEEEFTPANRMREVGQRGSGYQREYRFKLLHRMLLRNVPLDKIAEELNLSVSQVRRDRASLYKRVREEAKELDINHLIGDSVGFYNEVMSMALRAASLNKTPVNMKLAAMRTSLSARNDMHRFLQAAGVYDVLKFKAAEEQGSGDDISKMVKLTRMLLEMDEDGELPEDGIQIPKELMQSDSRYSDDVDEEDDELIRVLS